MGQVNQEEFELNELEDHLGGSMGSRFSLFSKEFGFSRSKWESGALELPKDYYTGLVIHPNGRCWVNVVFLWSIYSAFFTPLEFGFFRGLPMHLAGLDGVQIVFIADMILSFFVAYRDEHTYKMVCDKKSIALR